MRVHRHDPRASSWTDQRGTHTGRVRQVVRQGCLLWAWIDPLPLTSTLEDAGCNDTNILGHLRGPGPHVKECHILDLLLDKR
jgi:hypothetical protein